MAAYSTTDGTLTVPPMLMPQWHTNTPTLGRLAKTSNSGGNSLILMSFPLSEAMVDVASAAAPLAWATDSGMSLGAPNAPLTNMPGLDVLKGEK